MTASALVVIPARMASTRLPNKPLAELNGQPMIVHVWRRAVAAHVGPVVVATDDTAIAEVVRAAGGDAVLTRPDHPSGSDRVFEAAGRVDPSGEFDIIVNVQGDFPTLEPSAIRAAVAPLALAGVDIATLAGEITDEEEKTNPNVVKLIGSPIGPRHLRALYFTRATAPWGDGPLYHHVGFYAYRRAALERFVSLPPSSLEIRERLEQLRALEAGLRIDVSVIAHVPRGVDTAEDLDRARAVLAQGPGVHG